MPIYPVDLPPEPIGIEQPADNESRFDFECAQAAGDIVHRVKTFKLPNINAALREDGYMIVKLPSA